MVLQAHSHNYERSYPILYNNEDSENPIIVNSSKNNYNYDINNFMAPSLLPLEPEEQNFIILN